MPKKITYALILLTSIIIIFASQAQTPIQILFCIIIALMFIFPFILSNSIATSIYKKITKELKPKTTLSELLQLYSASTLTYFYQQNIDNSLIADIINLEDKNKIKINADKIIINDNTSNYKTEKYILNNVNKISKNEYQKILSQELIEQGLITNNNQHKVNTKIIFIIAIILIIINIVLSMTNNTIFELNIKQNILKFIISLILFISQIAIIITIPIYYTWKNIKELINKNHTQKGHELYNNLLGLQKYPDNKQKIYSIIFNQDLKTKEKYQKILNKKDKE